MKFIKVIVPLVCVVAANTAALAKDQFAFLEGKWTPVTGPSIGDPIWFHEGFGGWDAIFPWWGQTAISRSGGVRASHIKVEGRAGDSCFYYISPINAKKMAWNLRYAESGNCPGSIVLERDPLPQ